MSESNSLQLVTSRQLGKRRKTDDSQSRQANQEDSTDRTPAVANAKKWGARGKAASEGRLRTFVQNTQQSTDSPIKGNGSKSKHVDSPLKPSAAKSKQVDSLLKPSASKFKHVDSPLKPSATKSKQKDGKHKAHATRSSVKQREEPSIKRKGRNRTSVHDLESVNSSSSHEENKKDIDGRANQVAHAIDNSVMTIKLPFTSLVETRGVVDSAAQKETQQTTNVDVRADEGTTQNTHFETILPKPIHPTQTLHSSGHMTVGEPRQSGTQQQESNVLVDPESQPRDEHSSKRRGKKRKARSQRCSNSYEEIRFLMRLGFLPIVSSDDVYWYTNLWGYVDLHQECEGYAINEPSDPFRGFRLPNGKMPESTEEVEAVSIQKAKSFTNSIIVRNALMAIARHAMYKTATALFGPAEDHEAQFSKYDIVEWCQGYEIRMLLFRSEQLMKLRFPKTWQDKMVKFDFKHRAHMGIKLLAVLFAGIIAVFRKGWHPLEPLYRRLGNRLVTSRLRKYVQRIGIPSCTRAWVRLLLFSLPPYDDKPDNVSVPGELVLVGGNIEHLCMLQLATVMSTPNLHMQRNKASPGMDTVDAEDPPGPALFIYRREIQTTNHILQKLEPHPWNKTVRWSDNTRDIAFKVIDADGKQTFKLKPRHEKIHETILENRDMLNKQCSKVYIDDIRASKSDWQNLLIDKILSHLQTLPDLFEDDCNEDSASDVSFGVVVPESQIDAPLGYSACA
eukprot:CAMPEP_0184706688 /NCGR_PEP_ID=MMETSP0313-20130426/36886_1 /TAXON_ID=2792 /ORGANISM="Porphyridium aerugineum, Strain SAG 1380-2" /LENGTH=731 /DNA_ID=CAMNT_0027168247 /DNA_START=29 /DNA_END=2220 /DNA_ORIENTATION=+